jgi:hypothetical protein
VEHKTLRSSSTVNGETILTIKLSSHPKAARDFINSRMLHMLKKVSTTGGSGGTQDAIAQ